jgi:carbonic anhydrase/acetyltransferase-like protein (isoleucine patch superfamily)
MILPYRGRWPQVHETAFVAPSADLIGDVALGASASVWFQCVLRGDVGSIKVGNRSNVQDQSVIHSTRGMSTVEIGEDVTIGHRVTLHGCRIGDRVLVGMGSIILDNAEIGSDSIVGAGSLILKGARIPAGSLVMGSPAKVVRELKAEERARIAESAVNYVAYATEYQRDVRGPARPSAEVADIDATSEDDFEENL